MKTIKEFKKMKKLESVNTEDLIKELQRRGYIRILWHRDDILGILQESQYMDWDQNDIDKICNQIEHYHDANYGINWDVIREFIDIHFNNKKK